MKSQHISTALCLLFLAAILVAAVWFNLSKPRVMILHSYHPSYAWTRDIDVGLRRIVDKWHDVSVTWHYMDTKKIAEPQWLKRAGVIARRAIDREAPQVLIAIDDLAQDLAARHYVDRPGVNIVFAGVNASIEPYGYEHAENVTGIFEQKVLKAVKETLLAFRRDNMPVSPAPKLLYILDASPSLARDRPLIDAFDWSPIVYTGSIVARDFSHWKEIVAEHSTGVDYILVANYRKLPRADGAPGFADPREVMRWTDRNSAAPVIGVNAFNVEDGAMLSVGVSPYEQGEVAAQMARRILDEGISANDIPMRKSRQYVVAINQETMKRRRLKLPLIYEAYSYFVSLSFQAE
jgi:ABC-type uncharacterized transport system substrate-binding protein